MTTSFAPLKILQRLGREDWTTPEEFGPDGWTIQHKREMGRIILTCSPIPGYDVAIIHASMAFEERDPTYVEMAHLHKSVWPNGYAYMVFARPAMHVNIHEHALHLWGRVDGAPLIPELSLLVITPDYLFRSI